MTQTIPLHVVATLLVVASCHEGELTPVYCTHEKQCVAEPCDTGFSPPERGVPPAPFDVTLCTPAGGATPQHLDYLCTDAAVAVDADVDGRVMTVTYQSDARSVYAGKAVDVAVYRYNAVDELVEFSASDTLIGETSVQTYTWEGGSIVEEGNRISMPTPPGLHDPRMIDGDTARWFGVARYAQDGSLLSDESRAGLSDVLLKRTEHHWGEDARYLGVTTRVYTAGSTTDPIELDSLETTLATQCTVVEPHAFECHVTVKYDDKGVQVSHTDGHTVVPVSDNCCECQEPDGPRGKMPRRFDAAVRSARTSP